MMGLIIKTYLTQIPQQVAEFYCVAIEILIEKHKQIDDIGQTDLS